MSGIQTPFHVTPVVKKSLLDTIRENLARRVPPDTYSPMQSNARNVTSVGTNQLPVTQNPQQIGVVSRKRSAIKITNLSSVEIWWSTIPGLIPGFVGGANGDLLPAGAGQWVSIPGPSVIWVACVPSGTIMTNGSASTGTARMSWAEKYAEDIQDDAEF